MPLTLGQMLRGRWEVMTPLGDSGRSYRARDHETGGDVVVRFVAVRGPADAWEARAAALRGLTSRGVERVVWFGVEDGVLELIVEAAPGRSLLARVREEGPLPAADARRIAEVALSVLRELHAATPPFVHGGLGAAHLVEGDGRLTLVGFSPEPPAVDGRADVRALGEALLAARRGAPADPALDRWLRGLAAPGETPTAAEALAALRGGGSRERPPWLVPAAAAAAVALAAGGGVWAWRARGAPAAAAQPPVIHPRAGLLPEPARTRYLEPRLVARPSGHIGPVTALALSRDGRTLASAGQDGAVRAWGADDGAPRGSIGAGGAPPIAGLALLADGSALTAHARELRLQRDGKLLASAAADAELAGLALDAPGERAFAPAGDGSVRGWILPGLTPAPPLSHAPGAPLAAVAVSPDGRLVASGGKAEVKLWDARTGALVSELAPAIPSPIRALAFSPSSDRIAAAADDGGLWVWTTKDRALAHGLRAAHTELWSVAFAPDGATLYAGTLEGAVLAFWLPEGSLRWSWSRPETQGARALLAAPDGRHLYVANTKASFDVAALPPVDDEASLPTPPSLAPSPAPPVDGVARARALLDGWEGEPAALDEAERLALAAIKAAPREPAPRVALAEVRLLRGFTPWDEWDPQALTDALETLDQLLRMSSAVGEAHALKARVLFLRSRAHRELRPDYEDVADEIALARAGGAAPAALAQLEAEVALERGDLRDAEARATELVRRAPTLRHARLALATLAEIFRRQRRFSATDAVHRRLLERAPKSPWARGRYAAFLLARGRLRDAAAQADEALRLRDFPAARRVRAAVAADEGAGALWNRLDAAAARERFEAARRDDPESLDARYGLVAVDQYEATQRGERCKGCGAELDAILAVDPAHAAALAARRQLAESR